MIRAKRFNKQDEGKNRLKWPRLRTLLKISGKSSRFPEKRFETPSESLENCYSRPV